MALSLLPTDLFHIFLGFLEYLDIIALLAVSWFFITRL